MSKSDPSGWSRIMLSDTKDIIYQKCRRALSDTNPKIEFDLNQRPAISNLVKYFPQNNF